MKATTMMTRMNFRLLKYSRMLLITDRPPSVHSGGLQAPAGYGECRLIAYHRAAAGLPGAGSAETQEPLEEGEREVDDEGGRGQVHHEVHLAGPCRARA